MSNLPLLGLPPYASTAERTWRLCFYLFCGLVLLFLISPILIVIPISFNNSSFLSVPRGDWSLRWYEEFFMSERWNAAVKNSIIIAFFSTILSTTLGTVAALGLSRPNFPARRCNRSRIRVRLRARSPGSRARCTSPRRPRRRACCRLRS